MSNNLVTDFKKIDNRGLAEMQDSINHSEWFKKSRGLLFSCGALSFDKKFWHMHTPLPTVDYQGDHSCSCSECRMVLVPNLYKDGQTFDREYETITMLFLKHAARMRSKLGLGNSCLVGKSDRKWKTKESLQKLLGKLSIKQGNPDMLQIPMRVERLEDTIDKNMYLASSLMGASMLLWYPKLFTGEYEKNSVDGLTGKIKFTGDSSESGVSLFWECGKIQLDCANRTGKPDKQERCALVCPRITKN